MSLVAVNLLLAITLASLVSPVFCDAEGDGEGPGFFAHSDWHASHPLLSDTRYPRALTPERFENGATLPRCGVRANKQMIMELNR